MNKKRLYFFSLSSFVFISLLCTSFFVFANSDVVSFHVFDKDTMVFTAQRDDGSFFDYSVTGGGVSVTKLTNSTRFTNDVAFQLGVHDDMIGRLQVYSSPIASDSPLYVLNGYKGSKINFTVVYYLEPICYDYNGNIVKNKVELTFLRTPDQVADGFYFYNRPTWTLDSRYKAKRENMTFTNGYRQATATISIEYSLVIPEDSFSLYGFTTSVGSVYNSTTLKLDEHWLTESIQYSSYFWSATFSDITIEKDPTLDYISSYSPEPVPSNELDSQMTEIEDTVNKYNELLDSSMSDLSSQFTNIWDFDLQHGFYVVREFCEYLFTTKPWNYLVIFSLVLGVNAALLKIVPSVVKSSRKGGAD